MGFTNVIYIPSCGIQNSVDSSGQEIIEKNLLTPTDTKLRCDAGAELFRQRAKDRINDVIVTGGGIYLPPEIQTCSAAILMKEYLVKTHGIATDRILTESKSLDSWQNIQMLKELLLKRDFNLCETRLIIVSHWTHVLRLKLLAIFNGFNLENVQGAYLKYPLGYKEISKQLLLIGFTLNDPYGQSNRVKEERKKRQQAN